MQPTHLLWRTVPSPAMTPHHLRTASRSLEEALVLILTLLLGGGSLRKKELSILDGGHFVFLNKSDILQIFILLKQTCVLPIARPNQCEAV